MTSVLLLRLQAPMQAWGVQSLFSVRDTLRFPTRSGIIGLLCSALGKPRDANLEIFETLRIGVRADHPGVVMKDFQTAQNAYTAVGKIADNPSISNRYYLSDAAFLAGLESEDDRQLERYYAAIQHPKWLLYLGRRAFPSSKPVWLKDGLHYQRSLEQVLMDFPYLHTKKTLSKTNKLQLVLEDQNGSILQRDRPISFSPRAFSQRRLNIKHIPVPDHCLEEVADVSE
ncbi:MAG: type I-E CRISPR-associated protein Cas5/CasD [Chloroflexota bacterium]|nr:type I-E CRISPR-associated protein Cas5/CasD [Chloroflexota bacterium]